MLCLAIVANLCFYGVTTITFDPPSTIMTSATAQIDRATVRLVLSSDNFVDYDPASMARACMSGRCISYHRWCSDGAGAVKCTFTLGDSHYVEPLTISAPDQAAMTEAIRAVGLIEAKHPAAIIPLALLDQQATDEYAAIVVAAPTRRHVARRTARSEYLGFSGTILNSCSASRLCRGRGVSNA